jgi:hypothetical protein
MFSYAQDQLVTENPTLFFPLLTTAAAKSFRTCTSFS